MLEDGVADQFLGGAVPHRWGGNLDDPPRALDTHPAKQVRRQPLRFVRPDTRTPKMSDLHEEMNEEIPETPSLRAAPSTACAGNPRDDSEVDRLERPTRLYQQSPLTDEGTTLERTPPG